MQMAMPSTCVVMTRSGWNMTAPYNKGMPFCCVSSEIPSLYNNNNSEQENFASRPRSDRPNAFSEQVTRTVKQVMNDTPELRFIAIRKQACYTAHKLPTTITIRNLCSKLKLQDR